jgi:lipopolysaccharide export system protein LptC
MSEAREHKLLSANWAVAEVDQLLSRITRYTRFVVFSKWFLMVFALVLVTVLVALPLISKDRSGIRISFVDTGKPSKNASQPVMKSPEYRSTDMNGQEFKVNGLRATQITPTRIRIEQVEAQMVTANGGWRSLSAAEADYNQEAKTILLQGEVTLLDDQGYNFSTASATVDTDKGNVVGTQPVTGVGPLGNLLASGFEIRDSGRHILFTGDKTPVRLKIERTK